MKNQVKEEDGRGIAKRSTREGNNWQRGACMVDLWAEEEKRKRKKNPQPCVRCFDRPNF